LETWIDMRAKIARKAKGKYQKGKNTGYII
jgi:hypothetical protein